MPAAEILSVVQASTTTEGGVTSEKGYPVCILLRRQQPLECGRYFFSTVILSSLPARIAARSLSFAVVATTQPPLLQV